MSLPPSLSLSLFADDEAYYASLLQCDANSTSPSTSLRPKPKRARLDRNINWLIPIPKSFRQPTVRVRSLGGYLERGRGNGKF